MYMLIGGVRILWGDHLEQELDARARRPGLRAAARDPCAGERLRHRARRVRRGPRLADRGRRHRPVGGGARRDARRRSLSGAGGPADLLARVGCPTAAPRRGASCIAHGARRAQRPLRPRRRRGWSPRATPSTRSTTAATAAPTARARSSTGSTTPSPIVDTLVDGAAIAASAARRCSCSATAWAA